MSAAKELSAEQLELFRHAILKVLDANNTRFGLTVPAVVHMLPMFGFAGAEPERVHTEVEYLERKGLLTEVLKVVSRENRAWRISQAGVAFLDARS